MQTAMDLFMHELADIRSAEKIFLEVLKKGASKASNETLVKLLEEHRQQTEGHLKNVDAAFEALGMKPQEVECKGATGLQEELEEAIKEKPAPEILDAMIASGAAKTEHYEITAYSGIIDLAKQLGQKEAAKLLEQNLKEEQETLKKVEKAEEQLSKELPMPSAA